MRLPQWSSRPWQDLLQQPKIKPCFGNIPWRWQTNLIRYGFDKIGDDFVMFGVMMKMIIHGTKSRRLNSKTKIPIRWHRAVRKKTALFWLEHKTSCAIYVACVKDPIEETKSPKNSVYWMTSLLQNEKVFGANATPIDGHKGTVLLTKFTTCPIIFACLYCRLHMFVLCIYIYIYIYVYI